MTVRVLAVDDHELVLDGLEAVLKKAPGIEMIGRASDGREAVQAARELHPDVVVMDISMPEMNGVEAVRQIRAAQPEVRVLCLSMHEERQFVAAAFESGAAGYILKERTAEEVIRGIHTVMAGEKFVCSRIASTVVGDYRSLLTSGGDGNKPALTPREREVLRLIAEGCSTKVIASRLNLSAKTVATHRENIRQKLDIHSTAGLTKYALRHQLTEP